MVVDSALDQAVRIQTLGPFCESRRNFSGLYAPETSCLKRTFIHIIIKNNKTALLS